MTRMERFYLAGTLVVTHPRARGRNDGIRVPRHSDYHMSSTP